MSFGPNKRIALLALGIFAMDQASKKAVLNYLGYAEERVVIDGFFKFVHWVNTGAAWSMFHGNNTLLAVLGLLALTALVLLRHKFSIHTPLGWVAMGLLFGGIAGNLLDRLLPTRRHVIDFLYFYLKRRGEGGEIGFPAFNVADSAICIGVGLLFVLSFQQEKKPDAAPGRETPAP